MGINTLNESSLHKSLKNLYSLEDGSRTEVEADGHIYDILTKDGNVIEIQTKNLSKLLTKALDALKNGRKFTIVHPIIQKKIIETYDEEGKLISRRKSPKKENLYSVFRELTGLYPVILEKNFTLELVFISLTEYRTQTEKPEQSANKLRRFKKNWNKTDKQLNEIIKVRKFNGREDYLKLLPKELPEEFSAKDIIIELKKNKETINSASNNAHLMLWVYNHVNLIEYTSTKNRTKFYKKKSVK